MGGRISCRPLTRGYLHLFKVIDGEMRKGEIYNHAGNELYYEFYICLISAACLSAVLFGCCFALGLFLRRALAAVGQRLTLAHIGSAVKRNLRPA